MLPGPTESRLLSENVTPAEPSAPVTSESDSCTGMPTVAGSRWPCRSRNTDPVATLICPTSPAQTPPAKQDRHTKSVQRMMALPKGPFNGFYNAPDPMDYSVKNSRLAMFPSRLAQLRPLSPFLTDFSDHVCIQPERLPRPHP